MEAKKDDFEQGTAQCLVSMDACAWQNAQKQHVIPVFGVVTNGSGWQFYQRDDLGEYTESVLFTSGDAPHLLGALDFIFAECEKNLVS